MIAGEPLNIETRSNFGFKKERWQTDMFEHVSVWCTTEAWDSHSISQMALCVVELTFKKPRDNGLTDLCITALTTSLMTSQSVLSEPCHSPGLSVPFFLSSCWHLTFLYLRWNCQSRADSLQGELPTASLQTSLVSNGTEGFLINVERNTEQRRYLLML